MKCSLILTSLATCLALSGCNAFAMGLNPVQVAVAENLSNALTQIALIEGQDGSFVQFYFEEAFPESDNSIVHPEVLKDRVEIFDHLVKERIKTNLELIQDVNIYDLVMNSYVGRLYTSTIVCKRAALREKILRFPRLPSSSNS